MIPALSALVFATPVFGLSLSIDLPALELADPAAIVADSAAAAPEDPAATQDATAASPDASTADAPPPGAAQDDVAPTTVAALEEGDGAEEAPEDVATQMARRARFARMHRILGLTTFASMTATVVLGTLQYANLYGFFDARGNTRCDRGNAFFGQDACLGTPTPHLAAAFTTAGLYYATFGLSYAMPDPIGLDQGPSRSARRLRQHKRLRWAHFTGMALQIVLGMVSANSQWLGLDRANDYRAQQALATVHLLSGYMTYGTLTWAGALMTVD